MNKESIARSAKKEGAPDVAFVMVVAGVLHLVILSLVDSAIQNSMLLEHDWNTRRWNDEDFGAEGNFRSRMRASVSVDGRGTASSSERPRLDTKTARGTEEVRAVVRSVGRNALPTKHGVTQRTMLTLLRFFVEYVEVAGTVRTDAENPGEIHRGPVTVEFYLVAGQARVGTVDVELVDGVRQHRPGLAPATATVAADDDVVHGPTLPDRREAARFRRRRRRLHFLWSAVVAVVIVVVGEKNLAADSRIKIRKLEVIRNGAQCADYPHHHDY